MKIKHTLLTILAVCLTPMLLNGAATITGTALLNVTGLDDGDLGVVLVDQSGTGFNAAALNGISLGADLTDSATYTGFTVLAFNTASEVGPGFTTFEFATGNFDVNSQPIVTGDSFGILIFEGGSITAGAGSYGIFTDAGWLIPDDVTSPTFGGAYDTLQSVGPGATGSVVPEPSAFSLLAGCFGLGWVMLRRRG